MELGARPAEGGDQGEDGGGGQEEAEGGQGQHHRHLVHPGVEPRISEVNTACVICPASRNYMNYESERIQRLHLLLIGCLHHVPSSPHLLTACLEAE